MPDLTAVAVFLGLVIASQSLLPAPALQRLGLGKSRALLAAEGATTVTETLRTACLVVAAFAFRSATAHPATAGAAPGTVPGWLLGLALLAAASLVLGFVLPWLAGLFFKRAKANDTVESVFVLALAFFSAWAGSVVGLEPFALAFVAGILLGRFFPERSSLERRLRFMGDWLFMPFFLIALGMGLDLGAVVTTWRALGIAAMLTLATVVAKAAATLVLRLSPGLLRGRSLPLLRPHHGPGSLGRDHGRSRLHDRRHR